MVLVRICSSSIYLNVFTCNLCRFDCWFYRINSYCHEKEEIHILILTDLIGLAMIFVVSAVGTDLAESLILPGLVVELAETLAISEILLSREMHIIEQNPKRSLPEGTSLFPIPFNLDLEIMTTAPNFIALVLIAYGIFLTGFTGGAVAGGGILLYAISKKAKVYLFSL